MEKKKNNNKLTLMMVPHNGRGIKSIEITAVFLLVSSFILVMILATSMFFTYQYISTKSTLEKNYTYITERDITLDNISQEIEQTSELSQRFTTELEKSKSLFKQSAFNNGESDLDELRYGDFEQALNLSSQGYSENKDIALLLSLSKQMENNLPLLENMNELVGSQQDLFRDLPVHWPVRGARVSMEWGPNIHPVYGSWYIHKGIDLAAFTGTPVESAANGEVTFVGYDMGYGLHVYVSHKYGFKTHYSHLRSIQVSKGQKIEQGQIIGRVGSTGLVTGPHLDFQLYLGNELIDPGVYLRVLHTYERPWGNR